MTVLAFLALWFVAGVAALVLLIGTVRALDGGEQDTTALDLWDDWDYQSERGGW